MLGTRQSGMFWPEYAIYTLIVARAIPFTLSSSLSLFPGRRSMAMLSFCRQLRRRRLLRLHMRVGRLRLHFGLQLRRSWGGLQGGHRHRRRLLRFVGRGRVLRRHQQHRGMFVRQGCVTVLR